MSKGGVYPDIPVIGRVIAIWDEVFVKIIVSFDGMLIRKEVFSESTHFIEGHLDVVIEVINIHSSVSFELCIDWDLIEFL